MSHLLKILTLCVALFAAGGGAAAPLKVVGRFLQDTHGNDIMLRGVNLPVYKSGYLDDLNDVAAAIALTKTNAVRLEWWANAPAGTTEYTLANFDRAIQKFYDLGIIPIVELHDLTFPYDQGGPPGSLNAKGNDRVLFANTITAFWTRADVVAILVKHQDHLVINFANEWGSSFYDDTTSAAANFITNYTDAIAAMRNAGITAPLMVDAPKGAEYQFLLDHAAALNAMDPQHSTLFSVHAYWAASDPAYSDANVLAIEDDLMNSGLPVVLGEVSSNAYTNIPCDPVHYANLLTRANTNKLGYLFWSWYEDGTCAIGQLMNITVGPPPNGTGTVLPTVANPGFGYDALYAAGYGIDAALPATQKADFTAAGSALVNTSLNYNTTSTNDNVLRASTAQVTRLNNFGVEKRPVVVLMPGWGGVGDVVAAQDAQAILFANQGYVAVNVGFHQTGNPPAIGLAAWYSDLSESVKAALETLCLQSYADCSAVVLTGESFGGTQVHPVVRYLRANNVFDGSGGTNAGRNVLGLLGQDSGYTKYWSAPVDADASAYSIALIQNLGDTTFPTDICDDSGNCGARNRADYHKTAGGSANVLSYCPAGGEHGTRGYANWDAWVLSAVKTMLHIQRGVTKFTGYVEPTVAVSNACVTNAPTTYALTVAPTGSGTVTSSPAGIDCGATCSANFTSGISVTLTATPALGNTFSSWGGDCSGSGGCVVSMGAARNVTAVFAAAPSSCLPGTYSVTGMSPCTAAPVGTYVSTTGATSATACAVGYFSSSTASVSCSPAPAGSFVATMGASAATLCPAGRFSSTSGSSACIISPPNYFVSTPGSTFATPCPANTTSAAGSASCSAGTDVALTVTNTGTGSGSVRSDVAGIDCGSQCSSRFLIGSVITLTGTPASGSSFTGWSGACTGTGSCVVTMNDTQSVTATFALPTGTLTTRYRLYSELTKEHLYTTDFNEYSVLPVCCGWKAEGAIYRLFQSTGSAAGVDAVPYYRLYNRYSYQHHWTTDANEYNALGAQGWTKEGIDGYVLPSQANGSVPLYRLYLNASGGLHLWTTDANEKNVLSNSQGWKDEGIAGYVLPLP